MKMRRFNSSNVFRLTLALTLLYFATTQLALTTAAAVTESKKTTVSVPAKPGKLTTAAAVKTTVKTKPGKRNILDSLGENVEKAQEKIEKAQEKIEKVQEKIEKEQHKIEKTLDKLGMGKEEVQDGIDEANDISNEGVGTLEEAKESFLSKVPKWVYYAAIPVGIVLVAGVIFFLYKSDYLPVSSS